MPEKTVMTAEDMRRTLSRIAHEITERNKDTSSLVLVGMRTRGVPLADRLASLISEFEGVKVPVGALDFSLYRDDLNRGNFNPQVKSTDIPVSIDDKVIILVDDVLYTGRSTRACNGRTHRLRTTPGHPIGGSHRPRTPGTADPRRLCRQEYPLRRHRGYPGKTCRNR